MVVSDNQETRSRGLRGNLCELLHRRLQIEREMKEIDQQVAQVEGALAENEATRRDIATEAAIVASNLQEPPKE